MGTSPEVPIARVRARVRRVGTLGGIARPFVRPGLAVAALLLAAGLPGCSTGDDEVRLEAVVQGLAGPTQMAWHPDGRLLVAELGVGGEGEATGRVLAIALTDGTIDVAADADASEVLVEGLDTPTGLAVAGGSLWIMERTRLVTAPLVGGPVTVVRDELPTNGRSNGSLTTTDDGRLLFDTSGRQDERGAAQGSGVLWSLDPTDPDRAEQPVLIGMKHAYAVAEVHEGEASEGEVADRLLVTEIGDGTYDGKRPPDEVVVVPVPRGPEPATGGWPRCVGDRVPVVENGGTADGCADTLAPLAVFEPGATPTGIAVAPWDPTRAVVVLWVSGTVVEIPFDPDRGPGDPPVEPIAVATDLAGPQDLLVDGDRMLLTVHRDGTVVAITSP